MENAETFIVFLSFNKLSRGFYLLIYFLTQAN